MKPKVAIVGRPNVGKSTLFNRMVGGRPALVHDTPGLTRDRRYGELDYFGRVIDLIDTGGLDPSAESDVIGAGIHRQAWRAIDEADVLMLVVDGTEGLAPVDAEVARTVRATGKPIILAVNKVDSPKRDVTVAEFFQLGLGEPYPVSAAHGRGVDRLIDALMEVVPKPDGDEAETVQADEDADRDGDDGDDGDDGEDYQFDDNGEVIGADAGDDGEVGDEADDDGEAEPDEDDASAPIRARPGQQAGHGGWKRRTQDEIRSARDLKHRADAPAGPIRVAFVGKPNAGKSSLTNRLLGEERSLVHHEPGTTTDPVDSPLEFGGNSYILVDTAGVRRKARIEEDVEKLASILAMGQIQRADVVVLVIDASYGPSEQDARLAGLVEDSGKALVIALNKSDLVRGDAANEKLRETVKDNFHFLPWAPVTTLSAQRGDGVDRLMDQVNKVAAQHRRRVATSELNRFYDQVCEVVPPPVWRGRSVRVYFLTQAAVRPPTFVLMCSQPEGVSPAYRRFLSNQLRKRYGFKGTPIRVFTRSKDKQKKKP